ncbi:MAG: HDOD domain-containing protein [Lacipirellulaceae bacterium]
MTAATATEDRPAFASSSMRAIHPSIEPLFEKLAGLCSLPTVAHQVIQVAQDPKADAYDLLAIIEQDAAIAARLMKLVNSSFCGLRREVADLRSAVALLGTDRVRNLALSVSIGNHFGRVTPVGALDPVRLWDHSLCVATLARLISERRRYCPPDEAYLAGLMHDLGMMFVLQQLDTLVPRVLVRMQTGASLCDSEREVMAFDHAQLGAYVAWRSDLPERIVTAIDFHHDPLGCPEEGRELARVVSVANYMATRYGRGSIEGRRLPAPPEGVLAPMGLDLAALREVWDAVPEAIATVSHMTAA